MGVERTVRFPAGTVPPWSEVSGLLTRHGLAPQVRMIDGQLAFPDEQPDDNWRELRIGTPQGMVTVRREADAVRCVTWGNADPALAQAWNAIAWAFAEAGRGDVEGEDGPLTAARFRASADLPAGFRPTD
jgi:hypothetical protein